MPYIEPRYDQNGEITHYRINVSAGVNYKGQPIKHRTTWRPKPGMSRSKRSGRSRLSPTNLRKTSTMVISMMTTKPSLSMQITFWI